MKPIRDADERDAEYLACQLRTNSQVLAMQNRMQAARDRLHEQYLEVAALTNAEDADTFIRPTVQAPLPALDRTVSLPRWNKASGTRMRRIQDLTAAPARVDTKAG